jgi:hypothetical protein
LPHGRAARTLRDLSGPAPRCRRCQMPG